MAFFSRWTPGDELSLYDEFSGAGGSTKGAAVVPGVRPIFVANHDDTAIASHAANFPDVEHYKGNVVETDITRFPWAALFWASPACPPWTDARGVKRDFDRTNQQVLFGPDGPTENVARARALMEEVPRYLRYWAGKCRPVLGGVVENVIQVTKWDQFGRWRREIEAIGPYEVYVIAYNSMHARPVRSGRAPQSRDRAFIMYLHKAFGRRPDLRKWLSPRAYCPTCDRTVAAMQVFKKPGTFMGRYRQQYLYRCPSTSCRNQVVEPDVLPAAHAIDWTLKGKRIGDRDEPLAAATLARIQAGITRYWTPVLTPAGGTWRKDATTVLDPMPARTTRENDGIAVPLMVPVEGRPGKTAAPASLPLRTQTARNETGVAVPKPTLAEPFLVPLRGGGDKENARPIHDPLTTVTASGNHHGLVAPAAMVMRNFTPRGDAGQMCTPVAEPLRTQTANSKQSLITSEHLLVPYYGNGTARPAGEPIGTLPTRDRYALAEGTAQGAAEVDLDDVLFRMLEPHEIGAAMAFAPDYIVLGNKRQRVRQYGNAVTPPVAEVLVSALVEAITGQDLEAAA
ncbi:DNA cytosine methyltransferase [Actinomadura sp. KC216]|uniref:DNA cytosine methyltransferase n=1 Tax=Actinomadura sp. KC216 TaxID=2530370 RepID=UPI001043D199|nr:DNA cytosine methyltransferase [Actinomadura sp. KC216]TDB87279.1 DNA cytosine methyltransferase [Actinomadura sp. KC216]